MRTKKFWPKAIGALALSISLLSGGIARADEFRHLPVPPTVSPAAQAVIAKGLPKNWQRVPQTDDEWRKFVAVVAEKKSEAYRELREKLGVSLAKDEMNGVPVYILTPKKLPRAHRGKVLINLHGGGYVLNPGEAGTLEGTLMAGLAGYTVISPDYRMAPDHPFPAAIDDMMAVYRAVLKKYPAKKIGVFGASTGGAMALVLPMCARDFGLPLPAAVEAGTPWSDIDCIGDSYFANEGVDIELVSYRGWVGGAAKIYAKGHDLKDPLLSPIYGDVAGFPPTMLTSGTRDLFLSNTVRMHQKLRQAGRDSDLIVFEGLSHYQYHYPVDAPETVTHFRLAREFFEKYLR